MTTVAIIAALFAIAWNIGLILAEIGTLLTNKVAA